MTLRCALSLGFCKEKNVDSHLLGDRRGYAHGAALPPSERLDHCRVDCGFSRSESLNDLALRPQGTRTKKVDGLVEPNRGKSGSPGSPCLIGLRSLRRLVDGFGRAAGCGGIFGFVARFIRTLVTAFAAVVR